MILKSLSRKSDSTGQLVQYICRYVLKEQEKDKAEENRKHTQPKKPFLIRHNLRTRTSLDGFVREFQENEKYRLVKRRNMVRLYHTIISLSNLDKEHVTDEMLKNIGKQFIKLRGKDSLYLATKHEEGVDHIHLHFVISGTKTNGRSSRITKQKFHSIKLALDRYQKENFPQLIHSFPEHDKKRLVAEKQIIEQIKKSRQTNKAQLLGKLEEIYTQSNSREVFIQNIKEAGHEVYSRNGRLQGIVFENKKFRFSRLGFYEERIEQLDDKVRTKDEPLTAFQLIREGRQSSKKQTFEQEKTPNTSTPLTEPESKQLNELNTIRASHSQHRGIEQEELERTIEQPSQSMTTAISDIENAELEPVAIPGIFRNLLKSTSIETE